MQSIFKAFFAIGFLAILSICGAARADAPDPRMAPRVLGKADAPIKVDEYVSLTCVHCADFYTNVLPTLESKYVDTGKVRFVMHDFPIDGMSLKAAAVARCMPADEYFPFIKTLYANQATWAFGAGNPENNLLQIAKLGGLAEDKAKACANDEKLQEAIIAERTDAGAKNNVDATPTFIVNDGAETIKGAQSVDVFSATFDRLLPARK